MGVSKLEITGTSVIESDIDWHELVEYRNGLLYWRSQRSQRTKVGDLAGSRDNKGYMRIKLKERSWRQHRVIWVMFGNELTKDIIIDHINGIRDDNRIENLRIADVKESARNRGGAVTSKLGVKGVWLSPEGRYRAQIGYEGKFINLGTFATLEKASEAYNAKAKELHGEFYRDCSLTK
jgi:hypothetical protein